MTATRGDLMHAVHYGPQAERAAARAELDRLDEHKAQQAREAQQDDAATQARRILNVPDQDSTTDTGPPAKSAGDAMYEHHYGTGRRSSEFGATQ